MAIRPFLAMTAAEMKNISSFPGEVAWMACHFSPYGLGLSNLPGSLPPGSLLILNDRTPIHGHDPRLIAQQLGECAAHLGCCGVLLDFQRSKEAETAELVKILSDALPCPVGVSEMYAEGVDCPVFLSPVPPSVALQSHLAPWKGREIWLETAMEGEIITLTEQGAEVTPLPCFEKKFDGFAEDKLHCHYQIQFEDDSARFTLWRTREDLEGLLNEGAQCGITAAVGLYQELYSVDWDHDSSLQKNKQSPPPGIGRG